MQQIITFIKNKKINIAFYFVGFMMLGFSVNLMKSANLGSGAWDTVNYNVRDYFNIILNIPQVTTGTISFVIGFIVMLIVVLYRRKSKYLFMLFPIILVAFSIDFWNFIFFHDHKATVFVVQLLLFILSTFILPLSLALMVRSGFPAIVFDELMLMMVEITKAKSITYVRLTIELTGILVGSLFGYLTFYQSVGNLGAVNIGSFVLAVAISPIMTFYYRILKINNKGVHQNE